MSRTVPPFFSFPGRCLTSVAVAVAVAAAAAEVPSVNESQAVKGVQIEIWAAVAGPPKLPPAVVDALSRALQSLLTDKTFIDKRARNGDQTPPFETPAEFGRFLSAEEQRFRTLASGLKLE